MAKMEDLGEVISTDVLIVGGGFAGLTAAVKAKESPVDVLLVDKQTIGWAGLATKIGGGIPALAPDNDPDEFAEYQVRHLGDYLNDQEALYLYCRETYGAANQLAEWGVNILKDAEGKIVTTKRHNNLFSNARIDIDMQLPLRARARKMGVKILNKVHVVELLKQDDRVVGAVGFNIINGRFYIIRATATILANGSCDYRVERLWSSACGDGIAMAYRAGTEMRNAEFANFYRMHSKDTDGYRLIGGPHPPLNLICNVEGENLFKKYAWESQSPTSMNIEGLAPKILLDMEREVNEGRGPLYINMALVKPNSYTVWGPDNPGGVYGPKNLVLRRRTEAKELKYYSERVEVTPAYIGVLSCIKVDHEMKTSLVGLWAIGNTSTEGSALAGAIFAPPGGIGLNGLPYAAVSALRAAPHAARFAAAASPPKVSDAEVKWLKDDVFAPIQRKRGLEPWDAIHAIQEVVVPVKYMVRRSKDRLDEALSKIKKVQESLPELWAKDTHYLGKCHEAKSMAVCAEMTFRAALMRTESRGCHFREDYPKRDDNNWLKWIIVKQKAGEMTLSTEPVPIDKYRFKP